MDGHVRTIDDFRLKIEEKQIEVEAGALAMFFRINFKNGLVMSSIAKAVTPLEES